MGEIRYKYFIVSKVLLLNLNLAKLPFPSEKEQIRNQEFEWKDILEYFSHVS